MLYATVLPLPMATAASGHCTDTRNFQYKIRGVSISSKIFLNFFLNYTVDYKVTSIDTAKLNVFVWKVKNRNPMKI